MQCQCSPSQVQRYQHKVSGPLLDRIDIKVHVGRIKNEDILAQRKSESSAKIATRVSAARTIQIERLRNSASRTNSELSNAEIKQHCGLNDDTQALANQALSQLRLSARSFMRVLKVGRTIADLDSSEQIEIQHFSEALQYRL